MEVEYELSAEDLTALRRHMQKRGPNRQQYWLFTAYGIILLLFAVISAFVRYLVPLPLGVYLGLLLLGIGVGSWMTLIGLALYTQLRAPNAFRKALQQRSYAEKVLGWRRFSIDAQGICNKSEISCVIFLWKGIDKIVTTSEHTFIYVTKSAAFAIPRRAFADDRAFDAFVEAAKQFHSAANEGAVQTSSERRHSASIQTAEQIAKFGTAEGMTPKKGG